MAVAVPLDDTVSQAFRQSIVQELIVSSKADFRGYSKPIDIYPYDVVDNIAYIPFYYGNQKLRKYPNDSIVFSKKERKFTGVLREYQKEVVQDAVKRLNAVRCVFLSMATGKGKTLTTIFLYTRLGVKGCALLYRTNLFEQWTESLEKNVPGIKIQTLDSREPIDPDCDFYLINPINVMKRNRSDFKDIGFLIADEAHALCSEQFSKSLLYFTPKWCIGLSATPEKSNELDKIIDLHFGSYFINVPLWVDHEYYKFSTNLVPPTDKNARGDLDWGAVLKYQAEHPDRNFWIVKLCMFFRDRNILVLCKRTIHTTTLTKMLQDEKESVDYCTGKKKKFNKDARILVTTFSKSGVGFDHPKLDMLIVASDVEEMFSQYFGRCVRREDVNPIVIDLVDSLKNLDRHFATRKAYSISVGGRIKDFRLSFPEFFKEAEIVFE